MFVNPTPNTRLADNLTKTASKAMLEYVGVLTIKLIGGDTLAARDLSGRSDPYVIFTVGDQQVQSKVKFQTLQPVWNESFQVCVASLDDRLNLHVMDWDRIGKHDPMGDGSIRLEDLEDGKPTYKSVKLEHVECGTIHLQLTWTLLA